MSLPSSSSSSSVPSSSSSSSRRAAVSCRSSFFLHLREQDNSPSSSPPQKKQKYDTSSIQPLSLQVMPDVTPSVSSFDLSYPSGSSPLFAHLHEDLLVLLCEYFTGKELARLERVCKMFRSLLTYSPSSSYSDAWTVRSHPSLHIWRTASLASDAWPFPKTIDREHLERIMLKHLSKPSPTTSRSTSVPRPPPILATAISQMLDSFSHIQASQQQSAGLGSFPADGSSSNGGTPSSALSSPFPPFAESLAAMRFSDLQMQDNDLANDFLAQHPFLVPSSHPAAGISSASAALTSLTSSPLMPFVSPVALALQKPMPSLPPLNWKSILAAVESRRAARGTGTVVLDMGSCTVTVGLGGLDAGQHGKPLNAPDAPFLCFPAIALNDLVGDQIGSSSVRSVDPVSSISMPILHANETSEFSYCSPIWKYALQRVPEQSYCGAIDSEASTATASPIASVSTLPSVSPLSPSLQAASDAMAAASNHPDGGILLVCDQLLGSKIELAKKRAKVARILFALQPANSKVRLAFCNESLLSLLNTGKTTGVVLHVGFSRSTCAIFVNGRIQNLSTLPTRMVGGHIHSRIMLQALFSRRQFQPAVADMFAVIPKLKEACYVAEDTAEEQQKPREVTHVEISLGDKKLTLGHERFTSSDVFFLYGFPAMVVEALQSSPAWPVLQRPITILHPVDPSTRNQFQPSTLIPQFPNHPKVDDTGDGKLDLIAKSTSVTASVVSPRQSNTEENSTSSAVPTQFIQSYGGNTTVAAMDTSGSSSATSTTSASASTTSQSVDPSSAENQDSEEDEPHQLIKALLQSIVLSGRSTSLTGFASRFERDLNSILKQNTPAKVHANHTESSWLGGSVLASLSAFPALAISKEEFLQDGVNAILRHMEL